MSLRFYSYSFPACPVPVNSCQGHTPPQAVTLPPQVTSLPPTNTHPLISQTYAPHPDLGLLLKLPGALRDLGIPLPGPPMSSPLLPTCRNCPQSKEEASGWGGQNLDRWVGRSCCLTHLGTPQAGGAQPAGEGGGPGSRQRLQSGGLRTLLAKLLR